MRPILDLYVFKQMELMELCVLGLEVILSAILCVWFAKEKRAKSP